MSFFDRFRGKKNETEFVAPKTQEVATPVVSTTAIQRREAVETPAKIKAVKKSIDKMSLGGDPNEKTAVLPGRETVADIIPRKSFWERLGFKSKADKAVEAEFKQTVANGKIAATRRANTERTEREVSEGYRLHNTSSLGKEVKPSRSGKGFSRSEEAWFDVGEQMNARAQKIADEPKEDFTDMYSNVGLTDSTEEKMVERGNKKITKQRAKEKKLAEADAAFYQEERAREEAYQKQLAEHRAAVPDENAPMSDVHAEVDSKAEPLPPELVEPSLAQTYFDQLSSRADQEFALSLSAVDESTREDRLNRYPAANADAKAALVAYAKNAGLVKWDFDQPAFRLQRDEAARAEAEREAEEREWAEAIAKAKDKILRAEIKERATKKFDAKYGRKASVTEQPKTEKPKIDPKIEEKLRRVIAQVNERSAQRPRVIEMTAEPASPAEVHIENAKRSWDKAGLDSGDITNWVDDESQDDASQKAA